MSSSKYNGCRSFYGCLRVWYGHHNHQLEEARVRFFVRISRAPIDIIRRSVSYVRYTSSLWHAIQALAECLITCMSHHSSINYIDLLHCARSFPFAGTSENSKRHSLIGLGRVLPCSQRHPNRPRCDHVGHCGPGYMVPSAEKFDL